MNEERPFTNFKCIYVDEREREREKRFLLLISGNGESLGGGLFGAKPIIRNHYGSSSLTSLCALLFSFLFSLFSFSLLLLLFWDCAG